MIMILYFSVLIISYKDVFLFSRTQLISMSFINFNIIYPSKYFQLKIFLMQYEDRSMIISPFIYKMDSHKNPLTPTKNFALYFEGEI